MIPVNSTGKGGNHVRFADDFIDQKTGCHSIPVNTRAVGGCDNGAVLMKITVNLPGNVVFAAGSWRMKTKAVGVAVPHGPVN